MYWGECAEEERTDFFLEYISGVREEQSSLSLTPGPQPPQNGVTQRMKAHDCLLPLPS